MHEGKPGYECEICDRTFASKHHLTNHKFAVHEDRFRCHLCQKLLSSKAYLKKHIATVHEGRRDFECEICLKTFAQSNYLQNHRTFVHKGEKNFRCDICEKTFGYPQSLANHKLAVHEDKFRCQICEKLFASKDHLKKHISNVHEKGKELECETSIEFNETLLGAIEFEPEEGIVSKMDATEEEDCLYEALQAMEFDDTFIDAITVPEGAESVCPVRKDFDSMRNELRQQIDSMMDRHLDFANSLIPRRCFASKAASNQYHFGIGSPVTFRELRAALMSCKIKSMDQFDSMANSMTSRLVFYVNEDFAHEAKAIKTEVERFLKQASKVA